MSAGRGGDSSSSKQRAANEAPLDTGEADAEASAIVEAAQLEAQRIREEAEREAQRIKAEAEAERSKLARELATAEAQLEAARYAATEFEHSFAAAKKRAEEEQQAAEIVFAQHAASIKDRAIAEAKEIHDAISRALHSARHEEAQLRQRAELAAQELERARLELESVKARARLSEFASGGAPAQPAYVREEPPPTPRIEEDDDPDATARLARIQLEPGASMRAEPGATKREAPPDTVREGSGADILPAADVPEARDAERSPPPDSRAPVRDEDVEVLVDEDGDGETSGVQRGGAAALDPETERKKQLEEQARARRAREVAADEARLVAVATAAAAAVAAAQDDSPLQSEVEDEPASDPEPGESEGAASGTDELGASDTLVGDAPVSASVADDESTAEADAPSSRAPQSEAEAESVDASIEVSDSMTAAAIEIEPDARPEPPPSSSQVAMAPAAAPVIDPDEGASLLPMLLVGGAIAAGLMFFAFSGPKAGEDATKVPAVADTRVASGATSRASGAATNGDEDAEALEPEDAAVDAPEPVEDEGTVPPKTQEEPDDDLTLEDPVAVSVGEPEPAAPEPEPEPVPSAPPVAKPSSPTAPVVDPKPSSKPSAPQPRPTKKKKPDPEPEPEPKSKPEPQTASEFVSAAKQAAAAGKRGEAVDLYEKALGRDKNNLAALSGLVDLAMKRKDYDDAVRYGSRALRVSPNDAGLRIKLGDAYRAQGDDTRAKIQYLRAQQLGSPLADARLASVGG